MDQKNRTYVMKAKSLVLQALADRHIPTTPDDAAGLRFKCRCPIHKEDTPSFKVYLDTDTFYCFGCHESGSPEYLVSLLDDCSLDEARNKVYGDGYIKYRLDAKSRSIELSFFSIKMVLSSAINEKFKSKDIDILSKLKEISEIKVNETNIKMLIQLIKEW